MMKQDYARAMSEAEMQELYLRDAPRMQNSLPQYGDELRNVAFRDGTPPLQTGAPKPPHWWQRWLRKANPAR